MNKIAIIGTLDTKGAEFRYLRDRIRALGCDCCVIDCGVVGPAGFPADYPADGVARRGGSTTAELLAKNAPADALAVMARGAAAIVGELFAAGEIQGAISMGGGQGTYLGMTAMAALPIGVPKVMVSTLARAVRELFVSGGDTVVLDPIVDIAGLNALLRYAIDGAAETICALVSGARLGAAEKPVVAVSMFGITTHCADRVRARLEEAGYEVWVFHSNGVGGANMEKLIRTGRICGVVDLTTAEVGQTYMGGTCAVAGERLVAAGDMGIPQVVSVGGLDMVNFLGPETVPERYRGGERRFMMHNPSTTVMRTEEAENRVIGKLLGERLSAARGSTEVLLPLRGISSYDHEGSDWYGPDADAALFAALRGALRPDIPVRELNCHINDPEFADMLAARMLALLERSGRRAG